MKFKVDQEEFLKSIQIVQKGLPSHSTLPVLNGILLKIENSNLFLTTTNLEIFVKQKVQAEIISPGEVVIPARSLGDLVRNLPSTKIELESQNENEINLSFKHSQFKLRCFPVADFPNIPEVSLKNSLQLKKETLISSAKQVTKAASQDETRPILTGIFLNLDQDKLTLAATDSYRLAVRSENLTPKETSLNKKVVVPARSLEEAAKITSSEDKVLIGFSQNQILFKLKETILTSRLIEGEFPAYETLIPKEWKTKIEVDKESLSSATKRALILAKGSPLQVRTEEGVLKILAESPETGESFEEIEAKHQGESLEIAFNGQYLLDGLLSLGGEKVFLECSGPLKPVLLKGPPEADPNFLYLIMPIRV